MRILILLLVFILVRANRQIPWWNMEIAQKQGPNVCAVEAIQESNHLYYTEKKYWKPRKICGKQTIVKYECCAGYHRVRGHLGCVGVNPLQNVIETARNFGASKFAELIEKSGVAMELCHDSAVTLFVPSDESFDRYLKTHNIQLEYLYDYGKYRNLVANHMIRKRLLSRQWRTDTPIDTKLPGHLLWINKYPNGVQTVNCNRIIRKDQEATNGVVHVIDGVLDPSTSQNEDVIKLATNDGRFSIFVNALERTELARRIRSSYSPYTIFAPTNVAFQKISKKWMDAILEDRESVEALISHHVIAHPVCISSVISEEYVNTLQNERLLLNCTLLGPIIEFSKPNQSSFHGRNGLLYALDDVLLPDRARNILDVVKEEDLLAFLQIIQIANLEEALLELKDYTMFAPTDDAIYSLSDGELAKLQSDEGSARNFVLNHVVIGRYKTDEISSGQVVTSFNKKSPLRFQVYRDNFGIENTLIIKANKLGSNGILHIVSHILHPTQKSLDEVLRANGNFSIWLTAMNKVKELQPDVYEEFNRANYSYTFFIPSDEAFQKLGDAYVQKLIENSNYLAKTLKNHIAENMIISESFKSDLQYIIQTKEDPVYITKKNNRILVNGANLVRSDILSTKGVAHEINKVLLPCNRCSQFTKKQHNTETTKRRRL